MAKIMDMGQGNILSWNLRKTKKFYNSVPFFKASPKKVKIKKCHSYSFVKYLFFMA